MAPTWVRRWAGVASSGANTGREYFNPRLDTGMEVIIKRFTRSRHTVADPLMAGRTQSALAAVKLGRSFIGAWDDQIFIERLRARFALASGSGLT